MTHGARKGLADTALKTASSGYLTRRLVDVAQDAIIKSHDCGTRKGIKMSAVRDGAEIKVPLSERILGRVTVHDIKVPGTGEIIVRFNDLLTEELSERLKNPESKKLKLGPHLLVSKEMAYVQTVTDVTFLVDA